MGNQKLLKAILFDLDGTLVDSKIDFKRMKRESIRFLEAAGVTKGLVTEDMLNYEIEKRSRDYLRNKGVSEAAIQRTLQKVAEIMNKIELAAVGNAKLIEGVEETLEKLLHKYGRDASVCVLPEGPQTIPYISAVHS